MNPESVLSFICGSKVKNLKTKRHENKGENKKDGNKLKYKQLINRMGFFRIIEHGFRGNLWRYIWGNL